MNGTHDTIEPPRALPRTRGARGRGRPDGAARATGTVECDEAEFVVCCLALCDAAAYAIERGTLDIRGQA